MKVKLFGVTIFESENHSGYFDEIKPIMADGKEYPYSMYKCSYKYLKDAYSPGNCEKSYEGGCYHQTPACEGCRRMFGN